MRRLLLSLLALVAGMTVLGVSGSISAEEVTTDAGTAAHHGSDCAVCTDIEVVELVSGPVVTWVNECGGQRCVQRGSLDPVDGAVTTARTWFADGVMRNGDFGSDPSLDTGVWDDDTETLTFPRESGDVAMAAHGCRSFGDIQGDDGPDLTCVRGAGLTHEVLIHTEDGPEAAFDMVLPHLPHHFGPIGVWRDEVVLIDGDASRLNFIETLPLWQPGLQLATTIELPVPAVGTTEFRRTLGPVTEGTDSIVVERLDCVGPTCELVWIRCELGGARTCAEVGRTADLVLHNAEAITVDGTTRILVERDDALTLVDGGGATAVAYSAPCTGTLAGYDTVDLDDDGTDEIVSRSLRGTVTLWRLDPARTSLDPASPVVEDCGAAPTTTTPVSTTTTTEPTTTTAPTTTTTMPVAPPAPPVVGQPSFTG